MLNIRSIENAKVFIDGVEYVDGQKLPRAFTNVVFKADDNCYFEEEVSVSVWYSATKLYFNSGFYNTERTECKLTKRYMDAEEVALDGVICRAVKLATPTAKLKITSSLNASVFVDELEVAHGDEIPLDFEYINIYADEGFYFKHTISFTNEWGITVVINFSKEGVYTDGFTAFKLSRAELEVLEVDFTAGLKCDAEKRIDEPTPPIEDIESDYITLYSPTQKQLTELADLRHIMLQGGDLQVLDINHYITNLYVLPFNIDEFITKTEEKIELSRLRLDVFSKTIVSNRIVFSLGDIVIPSKFNNAFDFMDTEVYLYLPYTNKIALDVSYCIGQTLTIEYVTNLYSRDFTINIYSSLTDEVVYTDTVTIGYLIPYVQQINFDHRKEVKYTGYNKYTEPYVEVIRKEPYTQEYKQSEEYILLLDKIGYFEIENITLETKATSDEQNEIKRLLNTGVIIK